ncbi:histone-lysine N-methyltransferase EZH2 [Alternaria panax]|uniref:Histone-lysine N-methyltransferase EZH2 n=1 Tax=Alternaria panax TaxID=48097 RepID=A0AAD4FD92_9PLEO|nr:histone-lysine N-methyltransferase EZH2 [Alternaria panax]
MRPNGSLDAPIIVDSDETTSCLPEPTVQRRNRQTLEQDGIEEVSEEQQAAAAWKLAAAKRQAQQRTGKNLSNGVSDRGSNKRDSDPAKQARERTPHTKSVDLVDLSIDQDEAATTGQVREQGASDGDETPLVNATQPSIPQLDTHYEAMLPQRAKPLEPVQQNGLEQSIPTESLGTPAYHPHFRPPSPAVGRQERGVEVSGPAQPFSWPLEISTTKPDLSVTAHAFRKDDTRFTKPTYVTTSAPTTLNYPTVPSLSHTVSLPMEPIRDVADDYRERTTSGRVNTAFERDDTGLNGDNNDMATTVPTKLPRKSVSAVPRPPRNMKAIKSVKRRNDGVSKSSLPIRPPHQFPDNEQDVSDIFPKRLDAGLSNMRSASPLIMRRGQSKDPSVDTNTITDIGPVQAEEEPIQTEVSEESHLTLTPPILLSHEEARESVPERAVSTAPPLPRTATPTVHLAAQTLPEPTRAFEAPLPDPGTIIANMSNSATFEAMQNNKAQPEDVRASDGYSGGQARTVLRLQTNVLIITYSAVEECLKRHVAERHESHAYLVWAKLWRQRTFQEQELRARNRKQKLPPQSTLSDRYLQNISPFQDMSPIQVPFDRSANTKRMLDMSQEIFVKAKPKDIVIKSGLAAPTTKYKSDAPMIPPFKEYVSLRNNILADNESKLLATPYFQDEDYSGREVLLDTLPYIYEMTHDEKGPLDFRKEQCRFYKDAIGSFLSEIGITWNDILYWLLAPERNIARINNSVPGGRQFEAYVLERSRYHVEEFERDGEPKKNILFNRNDKKWREFLPQLKEPSTSALRLAAMACAAILQECEFSIWYLAQQSEAVQNHVAKKTAHGQAAKQSTYKEIMCRVCHQHNCLLHGEVRQAPEDSWKTDSEDEDRATQATDDTSRRGSEAKRTPRRISTYGGDDTEDEHDEGGPLPAHSDDDSDIEKVINYKLPANPDAFDTCPGSEMITSKGAKPPPGKFNANWWLQQDMTQHWEKRKPFFPCKHEGTCEDAKCRCFREGINCEKTCKCSQSCNRRFPGCSCATGPGKRPCLTSSCLCVKFNRECDADLCGACGASEALDPVNRYNDDVVERNCCNVAIQRGVPRKTLLGHSEVHGFGLYMGEDIKSGEYIGEYTGEAISVKEGDRRVTIYDYQKTMYLFRLNSKQEVDATYMGNKLRFINNADDKYTNCSPKNLLCNTVFRIALFATRDVKAGTELYFNYNYPKEKTAQFKQPNAKVVAVKQTKHKTKKRESLTSSQPIEDRSRILAATAKAREAKAAKRAAAQAMLGAGDVQTTTRRRSGTLKARKAATSEPGRKRVRKPTHKALGRNESTNTDTDTGVDAEAEASDPGIPVVIESQSTQISQYVQDTDEEDDEYVLNMQEDEEEEHVAEPVSDYEKTVAPDLGMAMRTRRGTGRPWKRNSDVAPAVAVKTKKTKAKMGGARPGAGRKRKRPVIINSDAE